MSKISLKNLYSSEINDEVAKFSYLAPGLITDNDIADLPEPVRRYFYHCGYIGKSKMINAKIHWRDVLFKRTFKANWMELDCYQFNSVIEPARIVYMKSKILGLFPFEARDKYQNGHGNMLIRLLKFITLADVKGKEMDESALVTVLAETLLIPTMAFQDYITWTNVNSNLAKLTLKFEGNEVTGIFHFNESGEFISFETDDRYFTAPRNEFKKIKWSVEAGKYESRNEIRFPTELKAIWNTENGDYEYFKGRIANIEYNFNRPLS